MVKNMEREKYFFLMDKLIKEIFNIVIFKEKEFIIMPIGQFIKEILLIISGMEEDIVFLFLMEHPIQEIGRTIKCMEMENTVILMEQYIKEIGRIINDREKDNFFMQMD
jgi:hypothetical protein